MEKLENYICIWCDKETKESMKFCSTGCKDKYKEFAEKLTLILSNK